MTMLNPRRLLETNVKVNEMQGSELWDAALARKWNTEGTRRKLLANRRTSIQACAEAREAAAAAQIEAAQGMANL